jgi:hypothetical protein
MSPLLTRASARSQNISISNPVLPRSAREIGRPLSLQSNSNSDSCDDNAEVAAQLEPVTDSDSATLPGSFPTVPPVSQSNSPQLSDCNPSPTTTMPSQPVPENNSPPPDSADPDTNNPGKEVDDEPSMAQVLAQHARAINSNRDSAAPADCRKVKARDPDLFDGLDPLKLKDWLFQCNLYFISNPQTFEGADNAKISFAISYLSGSALRLFQTMIGEEDLSYTDNPLANSWDTFVRELTDRFGSADAKGEARDELENLFMKHDQHLVKYELEFIRLSTLTGWDDAYLSHHYYRGLPARIKDVMTNMVEDKPETLSGMCKLSMKIDQRYWERQCERVRFEKPSDRKPSSPSSNNNSNPSNPPRNNNNNSGQKKPKPNSNPQANSAKPLFTPGAKSNIPAHQLASDGKLTSKERQRRFDAGLCIYCAGNHKLADCPKRNTSKPDGQSNASGSKPKARQAQATTATSTPAAPAESSARKLPAVCRTQHSL